MDKLLLDKVLEMPPAERVSFAELVLASIDHEDDELRKSWISEVKDRMQAVEDGKASLIDFEDLYHESTDS
ncbi:MAG: addiction module protein [Leptospirales bacterium]